MIGIFIFSVAYGIVAVLPQFKVLQVLPHAASVDHEVRNNRKLAKRLNSQGVGFSDKRQELRIAGKARAAVDDHCTGSALFLKAAVFPDDGGYGISIAVLKCILRTDTVVYDCQRTCNGHAFVTDGKKNILPVTRVVVAAAPENPEFQYII